MITRSQISLIRSLQQKKSRDEHGLFVAEGTKIVQELIGSSVQISAIYSSTNFQHSIFSDRIEVVRIKESDLKRMSSLTTPNEVLAVCRIPKHELRVEPNRLALVLDTVQDPGNLGTIIRIADWFGIGSIICSADTADCYSPKVVQATMGSIARIKVHYISLENFFSETHANHPDLKIYGTSLDGENVYGLPLSKAGLIVLGNESKGISEKILAHCTERIAIPNFGGTAESLNVATAAAIICSEFRRRN